MHIMSIYHAAKPACTAQKNVMSNEAMVCVLGLCLESLYTLQLRWPFDETSKPYPNTIPRHNK